MIRFNPMSMELQEMRFFLVYLAGINDFEKDGILIWRFSL
jgi:hypothetical protein